MHLQIISFGVTTSVCVALCNQMCRHLTCRPLHLSIIHENVRLTQYLVKLIVGVYMNLDIANNMRQVKGMYMMY